MTKPIITNDEPTNEFFEYDNEGNAKPTPYTGRPKRPVGTLDTDTPIHTSKAFLKWYKKPIIRYQRQFYEWRGEKYHEIHNDAVVTDLYHFLEQAKTVVWIADKKGEAVTPQGGKWVKLAFSNKAAEVNKIMHALEHLRGTFISNEIQAPAWLRNAGNKPDASKVIVVQNGILDLETKFLHEHTPDFFTMTALPFAYDPEATCPRWAQFVAELMPNAATQRELQKATRYLLSSDRSQQKIFLIKGPTRSGKGRLCAFSRHC